MPRLRHILSATLLIGAAVAPLRAQTLPAPGDADLTLPPEMRDGAVPPPAMSPAPAKRTMGETAPRRRDARGGAKAASARAGTGNDHPVELGVTMRGGSGTPRVYAPTGTSQAIQESGSAFGAAMKFGF